MSTQWRKLIEEQPKEGQAVWLYLSTSTTNRVHYQDNYQPSINMKSLEGWFWLPAEPPPAPPDESEAAFNEWWNTYRQDPEGPFRSAKDFSRISWNAALAWHKNKTKE